MRNSSRMFIIVGVVLGLMAFLQSNIYAAQDGGYDVTEDLWAKAVLEVSGSPVTLVWKMVGADITPSGDQVISGYFYANPDDFAYGSIYNPELFVKIYIAANGWANIAFNHVTVDPVTVYSAHHYAGSAMHTGAATLSNRLVEHQYNGVAIDTTLQSTGGSSVAGGDAGYSMASDLWARALLQPDTGPVNLIWKLVGTDTTTSGDSVVSGYFYASPDDFAYGSVYNPEVFVKIYIAASGWANIAFNHVTVANVDISSAHQYGGLADQSATASLNGRLVEHQYDGVSENTSFLSLELGETAFFGSVSIDAQGIFLYVDTPDNPLDGFEIDIPPGAYTGQTEFSLSHSPIVSHTGIENFNPVTPLISIETGGQYADEVITVKIPVTIEDGYHYMAFYYDEANGRLEGIPELKHDATSLTIATRHFSKIVVNKVDYQGILVFGSFASSFKVGQDNWPFENPGTYLSPGGICSGMSVASLYYYLDQKMASGKPPLFGRYDNQTSGFGIDDDLAIKLCSTVQWWEGNHTSHEYQYWYNTNKLKNDTWTYLMFCHGILMTGEPQYVSIFPEDGSAGHALVVYKKSGSDLYVADPNLPNDPNVKIEFVWDDGDPAKSSFGHFKAFESQWNKGTAKIEFTDINYIGKSALIDDDLGDLWNKLDNKTVGEHFPDYTLTIIEKDSSGTEREYALADGYKTTNSVVKIKIVGNGFNPRLTAYNSSSVRNNESTIVEVSLNAGHNNLGLLIEAQQDDADVTGGLVWTWTDFTYVDIEREEGTPSTSEPSIIVTNNYEQKVNVYFKKHGNTWYSVGSFVLEPGETNSRAFEPGEYEIKVFISSKSTVQWIRQIVLSDQNYIYDFAATQDCTKAKIALTNKTPYSVSFKFAGHSTAWGLSVRPDEDKDYYLESGEPYTIWAHAYTGCPEGVNLSRECYTCWNETVDILDCQGYEWTVSGSGSVCPASIY